MSINEGTALSEKEKQAWELLGGAWNGTISMEEARSRLIELGGIPEDIDDLLLGNSDLIDEAGTSGGGK